MLFALLGIKVVTRTNGGIGSRDYTFTTLKAGYDRIHFARKIGFSNRDYQYKINMYAKQSPKRWGQSYPLEGLTTREKVEDLLQDNSLDEGRRKFFEYLLDKLCQEVLYHRIEHQSGSTLYDIQTENQQPYLANLFFVKPSI